MKRKMEIILEVEEVTFFKARTSRTVFCDYCGKRVEILTIENAALIVGLSKSQLFRLIESGNVHFIESDQVYLCRDSLEIWAENYSEKLVAQNGEIKKLG